MHDTAVQPYYIPFRALTVQKAPNLMVAGKTMSQSFHANSATRLHPEEWATGVAAGAAAHFMAYEKWGDTLKVYNQMAHLQNILKTLGQPLEWTK